MYHDFVLNADLWYEYVYYTLSTPGMVPPLLTPVRTNITGGAKMASFKMLALCKEDPNYDPSLDPPEPLEEVEEEEEEFSSWIFVDCFHLLIIALIFIFNE